MMRRVPLGFHMSHRRRGPETQPCSRSVWCQLDGPSRTAERSSFFFSPNEIRDLIISVSEPHKIAFFWPTGNSFLTLGQGFAVKVVRLHTGIAKPTSRHTVRFSFASYLLDNGDDIRTVQEFWGHHDVKTTMIYTHVLNRGPASVRSPLDGV
jgi:integrase